MLFLANAIMKSPQQALMWSAMLGAATLVLSPFGVLSGAAIALVTLAAGLVPGSRALLASLAGAALLAVFTDQWSAFGLALLEFWLPAFALAVVLGASASLSRMLQVATGLMLGALMLVYLWIDSPQAFWLETMRQLLESWQAQGLVIEPQAASLLVEQLPAVLTMLVAMGLLMVWISMVLLARWWQTRLYDMTPFSTEFQAIALGNSLAGLMALMLVLVLFMPEQSLIQDALGVLTGFSATRRGEKTRAFLNALPSYELIELGSSLKMCRIAEGLADVYPRFGLTSEWDTAAAQVVLMEAGGLVCGLDGQALTYNARDTLENPPFIAVGDAEYPWPLEKVNAL